MLHKALGFVTSLRQQPIIVFLLLIVLSSIISSNAFKVDSARKTEDSNNNAISDHVINLIKRYRYYGHRSRYPWKHMAHGFCYRQQCKKDFDCCRRWNICDLSARVCRDCWYGSTCRRESDCCEAYPYCRREYEKNEYGNRVMIGGQCVDSYS